MFDDDRCWSLLAASSLGRVALSVRALPVIVPVRYTVEGSALRLEPAVWPGIDDGRLLSVVAFQADGFDVGSDRVWSVHAVGRIDALPASASPSSSATLEIRPSHLEGRWLNFASLAP